MSTTGDLLGTPRYMSPEQALLSSDEVDHRTDIYSLGAIFYELVTGRAAIDAPTPLAALRQLTDSRPRPLIEVNPTLPPKVIAIIDKMMHPSTDQRYANADEVALDIKRYYLERTLESPEVDGLAGLLPSIELPIPKAKTNPNASKGSCCLSFLRSMLQVLILVGGGMLYGYLYSEGYQDAWSDTRSTNDWMQLVEQSEQVYAQLPTIRDDSQYRSLLIDTIDDLSASLRRSPGRTFLANRQGKIVENCWAIRCCIGRFGSLFCKRQRRRRDRS